MHRLGILINAKEKKQAKYLISECSEIIDATSLNPDDCSCYLSILNATREKFYPWKLLFR